jgi:hypothetical protein
MKHRQTFIFFPLCKRLAQEMGSLSIFVVMKRIVLWINTFTLLPMLIFLPLHVVDL